MDQVKKILKHQFWILAGVALLLPLVGWWMQTASAKQYYTDQSGKIKGYFDSKVPPRTSEPNKNWSEPLRKINEEEKKLVDATTKVVWERQQQLMTWPYDVQAAVEKAGYRGEIADTPRSIYQGGYKKEVDDAYNVVMPYDPSDSQSKGVVEFSRLNMPDEKWSRNVVPPSSEQMWNSQEDLWLLRALLTAIAQTNQSLGTTSAIDATIRKIDLIELRGGDRAALANAPAGGTGAAGDMGGVTVAGAGAPVAGAGFAGNTGGGAMDGNNKKGVDAAFDPADELGPDALAGGGGDAGGVSAGPALAAGGGGAAAGVAGGGGIQNPNAPRKRYVEETPQYKTRGFYMEVVMDHRRVPDLLIALANSPWPIRVARVQQTDYDRSDIGVSGSGASPRATKQGLGGANAGGPAAASGFGPVVATGPVGDGDFTGARGGTAATAASTYDDPFLAHVALCGVITIYLPPAVDPAATPADGTTPPAPATPAEPTPPVAATVPAATEPAASPADPTEPPAATAPEAPTETPTTASDDFAPAATETPTPAPATPAPDAGAPATSTPPATPAPAAPAATPPEPAAPGG